MHPYKRGETLNYIPTSIWRPCLKSESNGWGLALFLKLTQAGMILCLCSYWTGHWRKYSPFINNRQGSASLSLCSKPHLQCGHKYEKTTSNGQWFPLFKYPGSSLYLDERLPCWKGECRCQPERHLCDIIALCFSTPLTLILAAFQLDIARGKRMNVIRAGGEWNTVLPRSSSAQSWPRCVVTMRLTRH